MAETQATINAWQRERFPTATSGGVIRHLREEFDEFLRAEAGIPEEAEEAADVVILFYCWAMLAGIDLHAEIDRKMAKNRAREWIIQPDGTGRHVKGVAGEGRTGVSNPPERKLGKRDGLRWAITWLHRRAEQMNDPHAKAVLNSAAFDLGNEIREGRIPAIPDTDMRSNTEKADAP